MTKDKLLDQVLIASAYLFFIVPLVVFFFGWLRLGVAIVFTTLLIVGFILCLSKWDFLAYKFTFKKTQFLIFSIVLIGLWVFFSGIGGFGFQNDDFSGRNAVFNDLVLLDWPVFYDYSSQPDLQNIIGESGALIYYFAFWLPSALIGKIFGLKAANFFLFFWAIFGIQIAFFLIVRWVRKVKIYFLIPFIFWGGLDIIGFLLIQEFNIFGNQTPPFTNGILEQLGSITFYFFNNAQLEWWIPPFQYSSTTIQLFWVFNQAIPAWVMTALILNIENRKNLFFTYTLLLLFAPLPAIGLIPFLAYKVLFPKNEQTGINIQKIIKESISFQNIVVPIILSLTCYLFYSTIMESPPHQFLWELSENLGGNLINRVLLFMVMEFGIISSMIFTKQNKWLWITSIVSLTLIPMYVYGIHNDFTMRASIPALFVLLILLLKKLSTIELFHPRSIKEFAFSMVLIFIICLSSFSGIHEILRSRDMIVQEMGFPPETDLWQTFKTNQDGDGRKQKHIINYVAGNPDEKLFFNSIGKSGH